MKIKTGRIEQLWQLREVRWDGDLICKTDRDALVKAGLVQRKEGWNWLTIKGVEYLVNLGILKPQTNLIKVFGDRRWHTFKRTGRTR